MPSACSVTVVRPGPARGLARGPEPATARAPVRRYARAQEAPNPWQRSTPSPLHTTPGAAANGRLGTSGQIGSFRHPPSPLDGCARRPGTRSSYVCRYGVTPLQAMIAAEMLAPNPSGNYRFLAADGRPFSEGALVDPGFDL